MFNKKQLYLISSLALVLSLILVQVQVRAAWNGPTFGPTDSGANPPITNPLEVDLNFDNHSLTNGASATFSSGTFNALDLKNGNIINVAQINNQVPSFGGLSNPLTEDLSGGDRYAITNLMGCKAGSGETCAAVEGQAGESVGVDTYAVGLYGYTQDVSGDSPSYAVAGVANNTGGVAVYGLANKGWAGYFSGPVGVAGDLQVIGNSDVSANFNVAQNATVSGNMITTGTTRMEGLVTIENGSNIQGLLRVDAQAPKFGQVSAIVGNADGVNYDNNAGVEGIGTVGVYGNGHLVGVFGESSGYGGIFKGATASGWNPPPGGGGVDNPPPEGFISKLFGLDKIYADVNTPAALGIVAAGGWTYDGGITSAGLGICALSGEKAYAVDSTTGDFQAYCKSGTINNFAGFFAGDVYVKEGSIQLNDTLTASNENLIYGNVASAVANSSLLKLQTGGVDKFVVDKDGNATVAWQSAFSSKNSVGNIVPIIKVDAGNNYVAAYSNVNAWTLGSTANASIAGDHNSRYITMRTNNAERLRVAADGSIILGSPKILDFNDGANTGPTCDNNNIGVIYYFNTNKTLCVCNGTSGSWDSLNNSKNNDGYCSNNLYNAP